MDTDKLGTLELGKFIKKKRLEKHISQNELADLLHVSRAAVSKWETGINFPGLQNLKELSKILDFPLSRLWDQQENLQEPTEAGSQPEPVLPTAATASPHSVPASSVAATASPHSVPASSVTAAASPHSVPASSVAAAAFQSVPAPATAPTASPDSIPAPPAKQKTAAKMAFAAVATVFILITIIVSVTLYYRNKPPIFTILENYHGSFKDMECCCFIVTCQGGFSKDAWIDYANTFQEKYLYCFTQVEAIVIAYFDDYDRTADSLDSADFLTVLYPYPMPSP